MAFALCRPCDRGRKYCSAACASAERPQALRSTDVGSTRRFEVGAPRAPRNEPIARKRHRKRRIMLCRPAVPRARASRAALSRLGCSRAAGALRIVSDGPRIARTRVVCASGLMHTQASSPLLDTGGRYFALLAASRRSIRTEQVRLVILSELFGSRATASAIDEVMRHAHWSRRGRVRRVRHAAQAQAAAPGRAATAGYCGNGFEERSDRQASLAETAWYDTRGRIAGT